MKTVYCYDLHVNGIFGRKRKPQREMFTLKERDERRLTSDEAISLAKKELERINLQGKFHLQERKGTVEDGIYSTSLFGDVLSIWMGQQ